VQVATPDASVRVFVPPLHWTGPEDPPPAKVTAPVGVPALDGRPVTLAVNDAGEPEPAAGATASLVRELAGDICNVKVCVDALNLESPGHESVTV